MHELIFFNSIYCLELMGHGRFYQAKYPHAMSTSHCVYMVTGIFGSLPTPRRFDLSQFILSALDHLAGVLYNQFKEDSSSLDSDKARERDMSQFIVHCSCYESSSMCNVQLQDRSNWHSVTQLRRFSSVTHNHSIFCPHELHSSQMRRVNLSSDLLHLQIYRDAPARA